MNGVMPALDSGPFGLAVFPLTLADQAAGDFGRGMQTGWRDIGSAVHAQSVSASLHALQGLVNRVQLGSLMFAQGEFQLAFGVELGARILRVFKMIGRHVGPAQAPAALRLHQLQQSLTLSQQSLL
jgi:hypothetical protein